MDEDELEGGSNGKNHCRIDQERILWAKVL